MLAREGDTHTEPYPPHPTGVSPQTPLRLPREERRAEGSPTQDTQLPGGGCVGVLGGGGGKPASPPATPGPVLGAAEGGLGGVTVGPTHPVGFASLFQRVSPQRRMKPSRPRGETNPTALPRGPEQGFLCRNCKVPGFACDLEMGIWILGG